VRILGEEAHLRTETPHPVPRVEAGEVAWRDVFTWPHASYIAVHFERFDLAPGERVVVRTPDGSHAYTFEGEGKAGSDGTFWATHVPGDTCEVLYYGNGNRPGWGYVVDWIGRGRTMWIVTNLPPPGSPIVPECVYSSRRPMNRGSRMCSRTGSA